MTSYQLKLHREAETALDSCTHERRDQIRDTLTSVAECRQPTTHSKCSILNNNHEHTLYKIRVGDYRIVAQLDKPALKILKIGRRQGMYRDMDDIYAGL